MDILINIPNDYLVFIHFNTPFVVLESISDRSTYSIFVALKSLFKRLKIKSLESDEEASFVLKPVLKYFDKKCVLICDHRTNTQQSQYLSSDQIVIVHIKNSG
jgi:hypothetical protein